MSRIKIAYILSKFPAFTETFIKREIHEICKRGISVYVFSLKHSKPNEVLHYDDEQLIKSTYYLPYFFSLQTWHAVLHYTRTQPINILRIISTILKSNMGSPVVLLKSLAIFPKALRISKILKDSGITNVHAHWATIPTTVAWITSILNGTSYSFTTHAWDIFTPDNMLEKKALFSKKVITISEYNKNYLEKTYPQIPSDKIQVIHIGLDLEKFKPFNRARNNNFTILSIGRLVEKKGFRYLMKACAELKRKNIDFVCRIIYAGNESKNEIFRLYEELGLHNHVELIPNVSQEKILDYYTNADCFVLPCVVGKNGDRDGIPTVIIEALAMGLPVVSTPVSGIPEVIIERETGLLVKPSDTQALSEAIEELYESKELRKRLGNAGRKIVEEKFEISHIVDSLLKVILETDRSTN